MRKLRVVKRMVICLILAFVLGLALTGSAFALNPPTNTNSSNTPVSSLRTSPSTGLANKKKSAEIQGSWKLQLTQKQFQDSFNQKQITEFRLFADLRYEPLQNIYFLLGPKFTYTTGFVQTQDEASATKSEWGVREISINGDLTWLQGSVGALDQSALHPSVLLQDQSFPAAKLKMHSDSLANWVFAVQAEAAIPTTSSLSTQTRDFEKTPGYQSASALMKAQRLPVEADVQIGIYQFQNLPSSVANKSALLGNTTTSTNNIDSRFLYEYQGSFADLLLKANLHPRMNLGAKMEWVQNSKAPSKSDQGYVVRGFSDLRWIRNFEITPFYEHFRIEPDAAVALYNSDLLGTNRTGYRTGLSVTYKQTLRFSFSSGERDAIYESPFQRREQTLNFRLETLDVAI